MLTEFAHVPILAVSHVPKLHGIVGMKVRPVKGLRMEEPITQDEYTFWRLGPDLMHHDIVRMQAEEHVWENGIIEDARIFLGPRGR